ncbi:TPA: aspartate ammonia-lyase, partial [Bacillus cereus]
MEPVLVFNLLQSISIMNNGFRAFTDNCLKGIEANENRLKEYVEKSVGIITAVNPHIGYEAAACVAKEAIATGQSVRELCVKNGVLSQEDLELILDPLEMTHPGIAGAILLKKN